MSDRSQDLKKLRRWLKAERHQWELDHRDLLGTLAYGGPADFVLQHGRPYEIEYIDQDAIPEQCYFNSIIAALQHPGWSYVEGYAMIPRNTQQTVDRGHWWVGPEIVPHAWCLTDNAVPVELTWPFPGRAYLGVVFHPQRAEEATWDGDANVLDDFHRGWPLLRERWTGEREWELGERSLLIRDRRMRELYDAMKRDL